MAQLDETIVSATPCLSDNELCELAAGKLPEEERWRAVQHIDACPSCAELYSYAARDHETAGEAAPAATVIGRYVVEQLVGVGASGSVYRAHDPSLSRHVAVKLLRARSEGVAVDDELLSEAHSLARLAHPNVVTIHDVGTHAGRVFLAMELARGSLRAWLRERPRDRREILRLLGQAGEGLAAAHATGLVHRDIKPDNILLAHDGRALVTDFGLARARRPTSEVPDDAPVDSATVTVTGYLIGTPAYMAPEQLRGEPADERSDLFSFCAMFFEALTGSRPYKAHTLAELRDSVENEHLDRAAARRLPRWLARILLRGLRADPARRWPGMRQLLDALAAGPPLSRTSVRLGAVAGIAAALVVGSLVWGIAETSRQRARAERRFADVRHLASAFLFEFDEAIAKLPGATAARRLVVERAQQYLDGLAAEAGDDVALQRELATAYERLSDIQGGGNANLGDSDGARRSLGRAIAIREELVRRTGAEDDEAALAAALVDSSFTHPMTAEGQGEIRRAVAIRERLAARAPDDRKRQRGLANAYLSFGEVVAMRGAYDETMAHQRKALAIYERLAAAHPESRVEQRNVALGAKYLGAVLQKTGDLTGAAALYRRAIAADGMRVAAAPFDAEAKLDLSFSVASLANVLEEAGDHATSLASYRQALALREAMSAADPADQGARATVARAHRSIGLVLGNMGQPAQKVAELTTAAAIYEPLVTADPADLRLAGALAETWVDLADTEIDLALRAPIDAAAAHLHAARAWSERARKLLAPLVPQGLGVRELEPLVRSAATVATADLLLLRP